MEPTSSLDTRDFAPTQNRNDSPDALHTLREEVSRLCTAYHSAYAAFERTARFAAFFKPEETEPLIERDGVDAFMKQIQVTKERQAHVVQRMLHFMHMNWVNRERPDMADFCLNGLSPEQRDEIASQLKAAGGSLRQLTQQNVQHMTQTIQTLRQEARQVSERIRAEIDHIRAQTKALNPICSDRFQTTVAGRSAPFRSMLNELRQCLLYPAEPQTDRFSSQQKKLSRNGNGNGHAAVTPPLGVRK